MRYTGPITHYVCDLASCYVEAFVHGEAPPIGWWSWNNHGTQFAFCSKEHALNLIRWSGERNLEEVSYGRGSAILNGFVVASSEAT